MCIQFSQVGSGGNSYYFHGTDLLEGEEEGEVGGQVDTDRKTWSPGGGVYSYSDPGRKSEEGAFLYPSLAKAVVGLWGRPGVEERWDTGHYRCRWDTALDNRFFGKSCSIKLDSQHF